MSNLGVVIGTAIFISFFITGVVFVWASYSLRQREHDDAGKE